MIAGVDYKLDCFNKMPLHRRKRLSNRKNRSHSVSVPAHSSVRPFVKRKQWTNKQMFGAMKAVQECGSSIDRAAIEYGVPQTTLRDRISGRVTHGVNPGPKPYLNATAEVELSTFSQQCASIGYGKTRRDVLYIAQSTAEDKSVLKGAKISHGWWRRFLQMQGNLS